MEKTGKLRNCLLSNKYVILNIPVPLTLSLAMDGDAITIDSPPPDTNDNRPPLQMPMTPQHLIKSAAAIRTAVVTVHILGVEIILLKRTLRVNSHTEVVNISSLL